MKRWWVAGTVLATVAFGVVGIGLTRVAMAPLAFDVKDPKGVNSAHWLIDSPLEPIAGSVTNLSGEIQFDPARPDRTTARITIPAQGLVAPVPLMTEHLHSPTWVDAAKHPTIEFVLERVRAVRRRGNTYTANVEGQLTLKGVTKPVSTRAEVTLTPGGAATRFRGNTKGDVLRLKTEFTIKRSDFGVGPTEPATFAVVGDDITVRVAISTFRIEP